MSSQVNNFWNFNVFDFFVHLIPGVITLIITISHIPNGFSLIKEIHPLLVAAAFIVIGYVLGQLIQEISISLERRLWGQPKPFDNKIIRAKTKGSDNIVSKFADEASQFFGMDIDWSNMGESDALKDLFFLTRGYLSEVAGNRRVDRFQALYLLFLSLTLIFAVGSISYAINFLTLIPDEATVYAKTASALVAITLGLSAWLAYRLRKSYHDRMTRVLIYDFYSQVLSNSKQGKSIMSKIFGSNNG